MTITAFELRPNILCWCSRAARMFMQIEPKNYPPFTWSAYVSATMSGEIGKFIATRSTYTEKKTIWSLLQQKRSKLFNLALWYFHTSNKLHPIYTSIRREQWPLGIHKTIWCSQLYFCTRTYRKYLLWKRPVLGAQNPWWEAAGITNRCGVGRPSARVEPTFRLFKSVAGTTSAVTRMGAERHVTRSM